MKCKKKYTHQATQMNDEYEYEHQNQNPYPYDSPKSHEYIATEFRKKGEEMKWAIYEKDNQSLYELVSYNQWIAQEYRGTDGSTLVHNVAWCHSTPLRIIFSMLETLYLHDVDFSIRDNRGRLPEEGARKSVIRFIQKLRKQQIKEWTDMSHSYEEESDSDTEEEEKLYVVCDW